MAELPTRIELTGQRISLRSFTAANITPRYISWLNDPQVVRFSNQRFMMHDRTSCERYLASFSGTPHRLLSIQDRTSGEAIGTATIYVAAPHRTADLGILVGHGAFRGRGYGQDAWHTLLDWLLNDIGLRKVTAGTLACNLPMVRLMERSNMYLEAVRRRHEIVEGREEDIVLYAKFRS